LANCECRAAAVAVARKRVSDSWLRDRISFPHGVFRRTLDRLYRGLARMSVGKAPVASIGLDQVEAVLRPIWNEKTETASRVRGRIEKILDWAKVKGFRTGDNPALWRGYLDKIFPAPRKIQRINHHAALPYAEIPKVHVRAAVRLRPSSPSTGIPDPDCRAERRDSRRAVE